jgi:hypothetical protein
MRHNYYFLWPTANEGVRVSKEWKAELDLTNRFACGHRRRWYQPNPVVIENVGSDVPLSYTDQTVQNVIRDDLRDALSPPLGDVCDFGALVDVVNGYIRDRWTLLWKMTPVIIRGKTSFHWFCPVCRQMYYSARSGRHVLRSDLGNAAIVLSDGLGLIVREDIHDRVLKGRHWPELSISRLLVLDKPRDGFPADLSTLNELALGFPPVDPSLRLSSDS